MHTQGISHGADEFLRLKSIGGNQNGVAGVERMAFVVCGWYTPDYAERTQAMTASLDAVGSPHDFVEAERIDGGWAKNVSVKPLHILAAIDRHPGKTIVFADVDCVARRSMTPFADLNCDIAVHMRGKMLRSGWPRWMTRTTVVVVAPTRTARDCIDTWAKFAQASGDNDQRTFPVAIARTSGISLVNLPLSYCAMANEHPDPILLHDHASKTATKSPKWVRAMRSYFRAGWLVELIRSQRSPK